MELNFLRDKEIILDKNDLLGTQPYVNTLLEIIKKSITPFTIGLFGGWGTGKSSIIETIKSNLNEDTKSNIFVFKYDAWKYSTDSFRRTFILDLKKELDISGTKLNSFYQEETRDDEIKTRFNFKYFSYVFIFSVLITLLITVLAKIFRFDSELKLTIPIVISFIALFISFFKNAFIDYKISTKKPLIFAPEQFENVFKEIVYKILGEKYNYEYIDKIRDINKKIDKIVIVIDNIDRCHKNLTFELLLTIKSFLEQKNVVFIVPIDETEIKKYLGDNGQDGNEFLRKLFNATITIKMFSESDLFDFSKKLNENHKLNFSGEVISLISQEFSKNPRKIIQFLNVLQTEIFLAEEQEKMNSIPINSITGSLPFFTKLLLIREEWPDIFLALKLNPYLLNELDIDLTKNIEEIKFGNIPLSKEQYNFFLRTKHISTRNPEKFLIIKDSFKDIPDEVNKLVESQDWKSLKSLIEKKTISFENLIRFIDCKFDEDIINRKLLKTTGVNLFSLFFKIVTDINYEKSFSKYIYGYYSFGGKIKSNLNSSKISELILDFDPNLLLSFVISDLQQNNILLQEIIKVINKTDQGNYNLLHQFIVSFKNNPNILKKINVRFSDILTKEPALHTDFKDILSDKETIESLVKPEMLEIFINQLVQNPNSKEDKSKIDIIKNYHLLKGLPTNLVKQFTDKILSFLNPTNELAILSFWLQHIKDLIKHIQKDDEIVTKNIFETLNSKNTFLWQQSNSLLNNKDFQETVKYFLGAATEFYLMNMGKKEDILNWLSNFFNSSNIPNIFLHINILFQNIIKHFVVYNWSFSQCVIDKFAQITDRENKIKIAETLNLMLIVTSDEKGLNKNQIQAILKMYIDDLENSTEWLNSIIKYPVIKNQLKEMIKILTVNIKLKLLKIIKKFDKKTFQECVEEIIAKTSCNELETTFQTLEMNLINSNLLRKGINNILKKMQKEKNEEYSKCILKIIIEKKLLDSNIINEIITIITPFLSNSQEPKENKIFALKILDGIEIPKIKKVLIKALLNEIDDKSFNNNEKNLLKKLKKKK